MLLNNLTAAAKNSGPTGTTNEHDQARRRSRPVKTLMDTIHHRGDKPHGAVNDAFAAMPSEYSDILHDMYEAVQRQDRSREQELFSRIRDRKTAQQLRAFLYGMLANAKLSEMNDQIAGRSAEASTEEEMESHLPRARPRAMDIQYLCTTAPVRVPARPWTTVTDDDDLVSHLVSLYLTWGYPFYAFFCRDTFVKHMKLGHLNSDFCSPFLVNALLANACFYSDYAEAYSLPGDVKRKGAHFLAEAEWHLKSHQLEGRSDTRLVSLQATLLLYERYSLSGYDNNGYTMLHQAIGMAESLGIVNKAKMINLDTPHISKDMISSLQRTAWGLFQIDTIVHMNFLRRSQIKNVSLDRIPGTKHIRMKCGRFTPPKAVLVTRDASWDIARTDEDGHIKHELYRRLSKWEKELPPAFDLIEKPAPYIMVLRMRYHTLVINLCCHDLETAMFMTGSGQKANSARSDGDFDAINIALRSAREIAAHVRTFGKEYGLGHSHQFAMYAINVSLFCLLTQEDFDILDPDFLSLTEAFSIVACRSQVGRHLFRAFKISVRSRNKAGLIKRPEDVPPGIRELLGPREKYDELDKWDYYAECLAEVDGDRSFIKDIGLDPTVPGLHQMLKWYENLSVGDEVQWRRNTAPAF
ncbi:uncharacterized protein N7477_001817 [Penicillium maclennaniae]|uniref:uncharacterized protein n=1 Tax=Penicillium maclennaniae TaxID=1343394 RepID=UPI002541A1A8|nr:uncharacterized protein N7477_001817 [Penicillium maclennaniae]KAJ5681877.1 hypothetical protein N7477_001817 [Penicillium maclennaniae]